MGASDQRYAAAALQPGKTLNTQLAQRAPRRPRHLEGKNKYLAPAPNNFSQSSISLTSETHFL